jgi:hypothetical protein
MNPKASTPTPSTGSAQTLKAAHKKYSLTRFQGVAAIEPLPGFAA